MNLAAVSLMLAVVFTALAVSTRFVRRLHGLGFTFAVLAVGSLRPHCPTSKRAE